MRGKPFPTTSETFYLAILNEMSLAFGSIPYADDPAKLTGNVKGIYSKSERLLKLVLVIDFFDAGIEGGRIVPVEAGETEVAALAGLEKSRL